MNNPLPRAPQEDVTDPSGEGFLALVKEHNQASVGIEQSPQEPPAEPPVEPDPQEPPAQPNVKDYFNDKGIQTDEDVVPEDVTPEDVVDDDVVPEDVTPEDEFVDPLQEHRRKKKPSKKENLTNLRHALAAEREKAAALEAQANEYKTQVENVWEREDIKDKFQTQENRIKELEQYEQILGLYKTEGFKERYYDGLDNIKSEATKIAADYEVSQDVIENAVQITNRKDLNDYLYSHFDEIGARDVRDYIIQAQDLEKERQLVEKNPEQAKKELVEIMRQQQSQTVAQTRDKFQRSMKSSWDTVANLYTDSDKGIELLKEVVGDVEHTKTRNSILTNSQKQFSAVMGELVNNGLQTTSDNVVQTLAARFQLGEVAAYALNENESLKSENAELKAQLTRVNSHTRPLANGAMSGGGASSSAPVNNSIGDVSSHVFNLAQSKLQK